MAEEKLTSVVKKGQPKPNVYVVKSLSFSLD